MVGNEVDLAQVATAISPWQQTLGNSVEGVPAGFTALGHRCSVHPLFRLTIACEVGYASTFQMNGKLPLRAAWERIL